jgi:hypothetical protein
MWLPYEAGACWWWPWLLGYGSGWDWGELWFGVCGVVGEKTPWAAVRRPDVFGEQETQAQPEFWLKELFKEPESRLTSFAWSGGALLYWRGGRGCLVGVLEREKDLGPSRGADFGVVDGVRWPSVRGVVEPEALSCNSRSLEMWVIPSLAFSTTLRSSSSPWAKAQRGVKGHDPVAS